MILMECMKNYSRAVLDIEGPEIRTGLQWIGNVIWGLWRCETTSQIWTVQGQCIKQGTYTSFEDNSVFMWFQLPRSSQRSASPDCIVIACAGKEVCVELLCFPLVPDPLTDGFLSSLIILKSIPQGSEWWPCHKHLAMKLLLMGISIDIS